jgi:hypothetical protein
MCDTSGRRYLDQRILALLYHNCCVLSLYSLVIVLLSLRINHKKFMSTSAASSAARRQRTRTRITRLDSKAGPKWKLDLCQKLPDEFTMLEKLHEHIEFCTYCDEEKITKLFGSLHTEQERLDALLGSSITLPKEPTGLDGSIHFPPHN